MNVGKLFGGGFAIGDDAGESNAWKLRLATKRGDLSDPLAHECLLVDCAFGGDNEIGVVEPIFQAGLLGENVEAGGELRAGKGTEAKAKAARGASAGRAREIQMMLLLQHGRESVQATLGERQIIGAQAFLGTVDPCATLGTQQRILHINGNCDFR